MAAHHMMLSSTSRDVLIYKIDIGKHDVFTSRDVNASIYLKSTWKTQTRFIADNNLSISKLLITWCTETAVPHHVMWINGKRIYIIKLLETMQERCTNWILTKWPFSHHVMWIHGIWEIFLISVFSTNLPHLHHMMLIHVIWELFLNNDNQLMSFSNSFLRQAFFRISSIHITWCGCLKFPNFFVDKTKYATNLKSTPLSVLLTKNSLWTLWCCLLHET